MSEIAKTLTLVDTAPVPGSGVCGMVLRIGVQAQGEMFGGSVTIGLGADPSGFSRAVSVLMDDLSWFIDKFYFFGCGGRSHEFDGDPDDRTVFLECKKCGAVKKENMRLTDALGAVKAA